MAERLGTLLASTCTVRVQSGGKEEGERKTTTPVRDPLRVATGNSINSTNNALIYDLIGYIACGFMSRSCNVKAF